MKTFKFLLAGAVALIAFAGCSDDVEEPFTPNQENNQNQETEYDETYYAEHASISCSDPKFTVTDDGVVVSFKVSGGEITIDVDCGTEWTAQNSAEDIFGCSIQSTSVTITAEQNLVEADLMGIIKLVTMPSQIEFATITVTQNAYGSPEITVDANEWHTPAVGDGLTTTIGVEATGEWSVENNADWLTVEKTETGLNLTAEENEDTEERTAEIVLTCTDGYNSDYETINVTQDGLAYITLSEENLEFDADGGEAVITVESNFEWEYTCESDWFSIEKDEENGSLKITCDASEVEEDREGVVTFTAGDGASNTANVELSVAQGAYLMPKISVETKEWNAPAIGELTTEIGVEANFEWTFDVNADWLTARKTEKGITLTAKENSETSRREGEVVLSCTDGVKTVSDTIAVSQDGLAYISLSEEELYVSSFGSSISVTVESNFDWECTCDAVWLTVTKNEAENSLTMEYTTNGTGDERSTIVTITAGDGDQNIAGIELKITQSEDDFDALILEYEISSITTIALPICDVTNATIDWGDGETTATSSDNPSHSYYSGKYTVTIHGGVKTLSSTKSGYRHLRAVKQWGDTGLTNMYRAFYGCEFLNSLPEVDKSNSFSKVTTFEEAFYGCTRLVTVPSFGNCPVATSFEYCFSGCTALTTVSEDVFSGCSAATNFNRTFNGCSSLTSVPENMFSSCTAVENFQNCFFGCHSLETVPENMFSGCTAATNFGGCFTSCYSLTSAPSFEGCSAATLFNATFRGCTRLTTVPENMFSGCTAVTTFYRTFYDCTSLVSAPSFEGCSAATSFEGTFYECTSLTTVPENMFSGCTAVTSFGDTFYGCSSLVSAPSFEGCASATTFGYTFSNCSSLASAPSFEGCSSVTSFSSVFSGCTALTTVHEKIFSGCTAVTTFYRTFYGCSSLKSVPVSLFDDTLLVTDFGSTFYGCSSISGESPYTEVDVEGKKVNVHLYQRGNYPEYMGCSTPTTYSSCFTSSTFSDIDSIPSSWGGNGN